MIFITMIFFALVLFLISYFLIVNPTVFLSLTGDSSENRQFLKHWGFIYIISGIASIVVSLFNNKGITLILLLAIIILSGSFSIFFSKKMKEN
ncbi:cell division protein FtsW (lipid II flippase) [Enterococcus sp. PF1-24]|uniref:hypothetical protein n=1 Tax=unclassified Enterococcus TaxID=2608891 RepID=UPI002475A17B|nr:MULTISPECIES: hypothetical protein [unclassified Enterococcus]MDH6363864.1 cell division protein FtsW (lipid II flippase) [Enterococcus sp. PFB1-1]MDH6400950.1 cell division protein FtsW (lipid II flippase) [Enterococcus sp. PF1-24]